MRKVIFLFFLLAMVISVPYFISGIKFLKSKEQKFEKLEISFSAIFELLKNWKKRFLEEWGREKEEMKKDFLELNKKILEKIWQKIKNFLKIFLEKIKFQFQNLKEKIT